MVKILGIDPSLTGTGLAMVTKSDSGESVWSDLSVAKNKLTSHERLDFIIDAVLEPVTRLQDGDIIVMEGPSFGSSGAKSHELAGGWWLIKHNIYSHLTFFDVHLRGLYIIPPRSRAKYATGNGNAKKDAVLLAVQEWYGLNVTDHNIADAIVLATMGARLGGCAVDNVTPEEFNRITPLANIKNESL